MQPKDSNLCGKLVCGAKGTYPIPLLHNLVLHRGIEPQLPDYKTGVFPLNEWSKLLGGGPGYRTLVVMNLARIHRSPLLPPYMAPRVRIELT